MKRDYENFVHDKYGYCYYALENNRAIIFNLYVEPEYRRQGHAKRLLNIVINKIRKLEYNDIYIEVRPKENSIDKNKLENFYKSMGLKILNEKNKECYLFQQNI